MEGQIGHRYEIQQQLGKNAGRRTLLARDLETQMPVVIKLLSFSNEFEWDDLKLFEREAETLRSLSHPAIPRYLDFLELDLPTSQGFALVQTYVEGRSLEAHLKAGRTFSEAEVKQIAKALLEILIYLHSRQPPVIHRDIKPSNVLLANRSGNNVGELYLVDFGSVQTLAAREGKTFTVVGTYGYMPPEQFGGRTVPASDLYSLGATLITLITGTHPADLPQIEGRIQFEQMTYLSPTFTSWLRRMIEPSLDRRFTSAQQALQAIEQPQEPSLPIIRKPTGSKVLLTKRADTLEILIPPAGFSSQIRSLSFFAIGWNAFLILWISSAFSQPLGSSLFMILFAIPHLAIGLNLIRRILFTLFGHVRLQVSQQHISLTHELFSFKFHRPRPASRQEINQLELEYLGDIKRGIVIWAGTQAYKIGSDDLVTEPELSWLADELSSLLNLPIQPKRLPLPENGSR